VTVPFTKTDFARLPEGFPAQLVRGMLVKDAPPTPIHQDVVLEIAARARESLGRGHVFIGPFDVVIDDWSVFQPDVAIYRDAPLPRTGEPRVDTRPDVVVEVLSPRTRTRDGGVKRRLYLEHGVLEVWLVDIEERSITVHAPGETTVFRGGDAARSTAIPGFALVPAAVFGFPTA